MKFEDYELRPITEYETSRILTVRRVGKIIFLVFLALYLTDSVILMRDIGGLEGLYGHILGPIMFITFIIALTACLVWFTALDRPTLEDADFVSQVNRKFIVKGNKIGVYKGIPCMYDRIENYNRVHRVHPIKGERNIRKYKVWLDGETFFVTNNNMKLEI